MKHACAQPIFLACTVGSERINDVNDRHDTTICCKQEPYYYVKCQGHRPHFNFVHRPQGNLGWSGGAMMLVKLQCRGVLLFWNIVGQETTALTVGVGGGVWTFFSLVYHFSLLSLSGRRPDIE